MIDSLLAALLMQAAATPMSMPMPARAPEAACTAVAAPPAELSGWSAMRTVAAGRTAATAATLAIGQGARATLSHTPEVTYALRPEKPGGSVSYGGIFAFDVASAGRYRVALGSGAWIDVVRDGAALESVAHGHGPECSGIRKMVDFDLTPGRYLLQVAANGEAVLPLMVARAAR